MSHTNEFPDFRQEVFEGTTVDLYVQSSLSLSIPGAGPERQVPSAPITSC
jgi:hypothetical protein